MPEVLNHRKKRHFHLQKHLKQTGFKWLPDLFILLYTSRRAGTLSMRVISKRSSFEKTTAGLPLSHNFVCIGKCGTSPSLLVLVKGQNYNKLMQVCENTSLQKSIMSL